MLVRVCHHQRGRQGGKGGRGGSPLCPPGRGAINGRVYSPQDSGGALTCPGRRGSVPLIYAGRQGRGGVMGSEDWEGWK